VRILLVAIHANRSPQAVPLANALLKAYSASAGVAIDLHDLFVGEPLADSVSALLAHRPTAVGFSVYAWNRAETVALATELRRLVPALTIFAGGPEATADPQGLLAVAPFDAIVCGEGELPFASISACLAASAPLRGIPGLMLRGEEEAFLPQPPIIDLDTIPSPWLSGVLDASKTPGVLWQLARGCSFNCDYCYDARDRYGVRRFSLERIEAELRHFAAQGVSQLFVLDSTFNQDLPRAKTILRLIRKLAPHMHFHFEVRSEFLDRELAQLFASLTCSLQIGLQSSDPEVLQGVGRIFKPHDFAAKIKLLNNSGAIFGFDLMIGLPGDTLDGFRRSLDFALGLYPNHLDIFPLAVLPDTALARRAASIGLQYRREPPYTLLSSPSFSAADLQEAQFLATACDIFYSRGKAVAWFNALLNSLGSTPAEFLADFGLWLVEQSGGVLPEPASCSEAQIWQWQRAYITGRFSGPLQRQLPLILDLVDYHYHYAQALQSPPLASLPMAAQLKKQPTLDLPWRLGPATRIVPFQYDILALLAVGEPNLKRFSRQFIPEPCHAVMYPGPDGVRTEVIHSTYIALLRRLDGITPAGRLAAQLKLPPAEALAFITFAAREGIITA
jgi:radical SAM superfamily enzyme YgiQ (UPF0313 family)